MNEIITPTWIMPQKKYEILMLQELLKNKKIERIVEIGSWKGQTALLFAMMVSKHENGVVYCCDLGFGSYYGVHYGLEVGTGIVREYGKFYEASPYAKHIKELAGNTHDPAYIERVHNEVGLGTIDFMFIDGDHSYEGVKADFYNFFPLVKSGGYIAFHDVRDTPDHISRGCDVAPFWREIKKDFTHWEFIDSNEYPGWAGEIMPSDCMGIGVIKTK